MTSIEISLILRLRSIKCAPLHILMIIIVVIIYTIAIWVMYTIINIIIIIHIIMSWLPINLILNHAFFHIPNIFLWVIRNLFLIIPLYILSIRLKYLNFFFLSTYIYFHYLIHKIISMLHQFFLLVLNFYLIKYIGIIK